MTSYNNNTSLTNLTLGKATDYKDRYDPALLQAVPRNLNREQLYIDSNNPPFFGADIWTLYELSWLNNNGLPQVAIGEVRLPANSINIIESKSFKLYLNSFNQTKLASRQQLLTTLQHDLSLCAQGKVDVTFFDLDEPDYHTMAQFDGECIDNQNIVINDYRFNDSVLKEAITGSIVEETLVSHLLKSNCLITNQPDWGSVQIRYYGPQIDREALLRYIISFRQHNEFHEQCVERIYHDLLRFCQPQKLMVYARYTRRGGLDINPYRTNTIEYIPTIKRLVRQ